MTESVKRHWKVAILWAVSLVFVCSVAVAAQFRLLIEGPTIVSGSDIGFRIERTREGIPVGRVVVRIDGRWVETASSVAVAPAR